MSSTPKAVARDAEANAPGASDESQPAKDPAAQALGAKGGKKRAERLSPEQRSEIARRAAAARWKK